MSIAANILDVFNFNYAGAIQDALGNAGASLTLDPTNPSSIKISGTPSGLGLKIRASQLPSAAVNQSSQSEKDSITLSPAAQTSLANQRIALAILNSSDPSKSQPSKSDQSPTATIKQATNPGTQGAEVQVTDVATLAQEDPTKVIQDTVQAAHIALAQLTTPEGLNAAVASDPRVLSGLTSGYTPEDAAAVAQAFKDKTLAVRLPSQVAGLIDTPTTTYTGTSQGGSAGQEGFVTPPKDGREYRIADFGVGQLVISWPKIT